MLIRMMDSGFYISEERGICMAIPRTTYLARNHGNSENYRNWNIRGEANLITDTQKEGKEWT